jgi:hypothetical protein
MNITMDIPIVMNDVSYEDTYDKDYKERRAIIWTLDLVLKGYVYGPIRTSGIIKHVDASFYIPETENILDAIGNTSLAERVFVQPGLTANGRPTTNAALSIPWANINSTDNYGIVSGIVSGNLA